jgi:hypothetical protein
MHVLPTGESMSPEVIMDAYQTPGGLLLQA